MARLEGGENKVNVGHCSWWRALFSDGVRCSCELDEEEYRTSSAEWKERDAGAGAGVGAGAEMSFLVGMSCSGQRAEGKAAEGPHPGESAHLVAGDPWTDSHRDLCRSGRQWRRG